MRLSKTSPKRPAGTDCEPLVDRSVARRQARGSEEVNSDVGRDHEAQADEEDVDNPAANHALASVGGIELRFGAVVRFDVRGLGHGALRFYCPGPVASPGLASWDLFG